MVLLSEEVILRAPLGLEFMEVYEEEEEDRHLDRIESERHGLAPRTGVQLEGRLEVCVLTNEGSAMDSGVQIGDVLTHINGSPVTVTQEHGVKCIGAWRVARGATCVDKEKARFARMPLMAALTVLRSAKINLELSLTIQGMRPPPHRRRHQGEHRPNPRCRRLQHYRCGHPREGWEGEGSASPRCRRPAARRVVFKCTTSPCSPVQRWAVGVPVVERSKPWS